MDPDGLKKVGGASWWKFRGKELEAEWIEVCIYRRFSFGWTQTHHQLSPRRISLVGIQMKKDKESRGSKQSERIILYVHGMYGLLHTIS